MWFQKTRPTPIKAPTKKQQWVLRTLILTGLIALVFFLYSVADAKYVGEPVLFGLLYFTFISLGLKICYEWYHYFSLSVPKQPKGKPNFTVDVLTTYCAGEPKKMLIETLNAIQGITYPHTTYLCDEANDPELKKFCEENDIVHVTREKKVNAKAGNINNALRTKATGELCLILDPDHIPAPEFLDNIVPYFQNEKVGFVQCVQAYKNLHENIIAKGSAQQTFQFYGPIMMGMNSYGTAQAIGANCTFRRAALDSIGGHAPGLAEDMNTSMKLHAKGWQSVYVPKVLNRGLVPNTISAYYKQQLKWSRGVFELLVTTYVQNFRSYSWRQKLHYGLLPWHYFFGFIFLINFLIPIVSLVLGVMPMQINLAKFILLLMPFLASTIITRLYVQKWVMEEQERGFHAVGGLLSIGTWWVHALGFIFTILRREVLYLPTPKDGKEGKILMQNLPNLVVAFASLGAIVYGLYKDYNPYSLIMAAFAGLNAMFMAFIIVASYQNRFRAYKRKKPVLHDLFKVITAAKRLLWLARHKFYGGIRVLALPVFGAVIIVLFYFASEKDIEQIKPQKIEQIKPTNYTGIYLPSSNLKFTSLTDLNQLEKTLNFKASLVASYLPWHPADGNHFSEDYFTELTKMGKMPLITWQPYLENFSLLDTSLSYWQQISAGHFNKYLAAMANHFKNIDAPIFLRFAHEPDNPNKPWFGGTTKAASDFKEAWRYVHSFMRKQAVDNLIWVYSPHKANNADAYFPEHAYVDWLSITAITDSNAAANENLSSISLSSLLAPYFRKLSFKAGLPVMLAELGTNLDSEAAHTWHLEAVKALKQYSTIKAVVLFKPNAKTNLLQEPSFSSWKQSHSAPEPVLFKRNLMPPTHKKAKEIGTFKGVNYVKAQDWRASLHPLFKREVLKDFKEIKSLGLSVIKRYGPGVYDNNILSAAQQEGLEVIYGFWLPANINYIEDSEELEILKKKVLNQVAELKDAPAIKSWHLGNAVWDELEAVFPKPELQNQRKAYLSWLNNLAQEIKTIDTTRSISAEVNYQVYLNDLVAIFSAEAPALSALGVNLVHKKFLDSVSAVNRKSALALFVNKLPNVPENLLSAQGSGWLLNAWQDDVFENHVSFNGLLSYQGFKKPDFQKLEKASGKVTPESLPEVQILKPAQTPFSGTKIWYQALIKENDKWRLVDESEEAYNFYWQLVKLDGFSNLIAAKPLEKGAKLLLEVPNNPNEYGLVLNLERAGYTISVRSPLTTPIYYGAGLQPLSADEADYLFKQSKKPQLN